MSEDTGTTRDQRLQIRITAGEKEKLRQAAVKSRRSMSNFVIDASLEKAEKVLNDAE